jgi:ribonuclease HI
MKDETITLQFDGGSRGNPGPAGIGVVLTAADETPIFTLGRFIGVCTNNVAEYSALITGLQEAQKLGVRKLIVRGDSELIIKQLKGEYRVKHPDMKKLHEQASALLHQFASVTITHNLRHKNELADKLANLAMDRKRDVLEVNESVTRDHVDHPAATETKAGDRMQCLRCGCVIEVKKPSGLRPHQLKPFTCQCGNKMHG